MSTVLVTGGAGFIGSHVTDALIARGDRVVVVDNLSTGRIENLNPKAIFYRMDICDPKLNEVFAKEKIEFVNHHAAQIDVRKSVANPAEDARVNINGLLNLLENCIHHQVKGFIFASSGGVIYGEPSNLPVPETSQKAPFSPYGVSKLCSEYYLYCYYYLHGLVYIALRYGNVYGPRQNPFGEAGVVAIFTAKMLNNETPVIFGDGEQLRDYVFIDDVVEANILAQQKLENVSYANSIDDLAYNIGTGICTSVNELFKKLREVSGFLGEPNYAPKRIGEVRQIYLDISKAEKELSWKPKIDIVEGFKRTVDFFLTKKKSTPSIENTNGK